MAYRDSSQQNTSGNSIIVDKPALTADGDHVTLWIITDDPSATTITWPSGFTEVPVVSPQITSGIDVQQLAIATKIAASEPSTWTISTSPNSGIKGGAIVHSDRDTTDPIHRSSGVADNTSRASPWTATSGAFSSNTTLDDCDLIFIQADDCNASGAVVHAAPSGFTLQQEHTGSAFQNGGVSTKDAAGAGETGVYAGTGTLAGANTNLGIIVLALAPAGPPVQAPPTRSRKLATQQRMVA